MRGWIVGCALALAAGCQCGGEPSGWNVDGGPDGAALPADSGAGDSDGARVDAGPADAALNLDANDGSDGGTGGDGDGGTGGDGDGGTGGDGGVVVPATVLINEVVLYSVHDWSNSDRAGVPWDATPGNGAINSRDQFIELVNLGPGVADFTGWTLELVDGTDSTTPIASHVDVFVTPGSTIDAVQPGHYVVIGDPVGFASTDCFVILRDALGNVVDDVELGGNVVNRDPEGDGVGEGGPDGTANGFSRGAFEEAIARPDGTVDTDDDIADFAKMIATPGLPNIGRTIPVETAPPLVTGNSVGTSFPVSALLRVYFDEIIDEASVDDSTVTVTAGGVPVVVQMYTFEDDDFTLVLNPVGRLPFDTDVTVTIAGGAGGVADLAGNPLTTTHSFTVHTEVAPANPGSVILNEIVLSPVRDWSNDAGGDGVPYSSTPGNGLVDSADEYIELVSNLTGPVDLSGYELVVYVGPNDIVAARRAARLSQVNTIVVGSGPDIGQVAQGDRIVVGDPPGALFFDCWLEIRDDTGKLIDAVEIGGNTADEDRGGDGVDNGAPAAGSDGRSTGTGDEAIARVPDGTDTGDDVADFVYASGTPGGANL